MELTLNLIRHPFEYDPRISAYEGLAGRPFDFNRHPIIAPTGSKVLTLAQTLEVLGQTTASRLLSRGPSGYLRRASFGSLQRVQNMGTRALSHAHIWDSLVVQKTIRN
jgi:hypothetical protein